MKLPPLGKKKLESKFKTKSQAKKEPKFEYSGQKTQLGIQIKGAGNKSMWNSHKNDEAYLSRMKLRHKVQQYQKWIKLKYTPKVNERKKIEIQLRKANNSVSPNRKSVMQDRISLEQALKHKPKEL